MELKDTSGLMCSDDYKDRFLAEYMQLDIRARKLKKVLDGWDDGTLDFEPKSKYSSLYVQYHAMCVYLGALMDRAAQEGIQLPVFVEQDGEYFIKSRSDSDEDGGDESSD